jgi:large subunit ribosomal protein L24
MTKKHKNFSLRLKIGDQVKVIAGEKKGFLGKISAIQKNNTNSKVILEGIEKRLKLVKGVQGPNKTVEIPLLIHVSNVMIWNPEKLKVSRIGSEFREGKKVRIFKNSNTII